MTKLLVLFCLVASLLCAQDWQTLESLPAVDFSGLSPAQKATALKALRELDCSCGCGMKVAECRVKDPACSFSRGMAGVVVDSVRKGMSEAQAVAAAKASRFGHGPQQETRILSDPVQIPVTGAPVLGPADARVTLVEFSDFQCPYCIAATGQLRALVKAYPADVKLIFKEFPLDRHSQAALAAAAALAAHKQGKFWPLHDALFAQEGKLNREKILALAGTAGLDMLRFVREMDAPQTKAAVAGDVEDGVRAGVEGTPTLFVNGRRYNSGIRFDLLKAIIDQELQKTARATR